LAREETRPAFSRRLRVLAERRRRVTAYGVRRMYRRPLFQPGDAALFRRLAGWSGDPITAKG
jgi:hypothetical protein